jgi:hypothetical protein
MPPAKVPGHVRRIGDLPLSEIVYAHLKWRSVQAGARDCIPPGTLSLYFLRRTVHIDFQFQNARPVLRCYKLAPKRGAGTLPAGRLVSALARPAKLPPWSRRNSRAVYFTVPGRTIGKRRAAKPNYPGEARGNACTERREPPAVAGTSDAGYFPYHAIPGNWEPRNAFRKDLLRMWYQTLGRRSERSRLTWERFRKGLGARLPPIPIPQFYPPGALRCHPR